MPQQNLRALCGMRGHQPRHSSPVFAAHPETGSAGRPPEQLLDTPALTLGRTTRAAVTDGDRHSLLARRKRRAVVDVARGGNRCADPLGDDLLDDHDAFMSIAAQPHLVTGPHGMRGLDPDPVDPDVPGPAGNGRGRAGPGQPHRPDPAVHPPSLITCHPATVMRYALASCAQPDVFRQRAGGQRPTRTGFARVPCDGARRGSLSLFPERRNVSAGETAAKTGRPGARRFRGPAEVPSPADDVNISARLLVGRVYFWPAAG